MELLEQNYTQKWLFMGFNAQLKFVDLAEFMCES